MIQVMIPDSTRRLMATSRSEALALTKQEPHHVALDIGILTNVFPSYFKLSKRIERHDH